MGMGHRIYRQRDPRAVTELELAPRAHAPAADGGVRARLTFAREVERAAESLLAERYPERKLKTNVEFYTAVLLSALAIDSTLFSPLFACARHRVGGALRRATAQRQQTDPPSLSVHLPHAADGCKWLAYRSCACVLQRKPCCVAAWPARRNRQAGGRCKQQLSANMNRRFESFSGMPRS